MLSSPLKLTTPLNIIEPLNVGEESVVFAVKESSSKNILVRFRGREPISWQESVTEQKEKISKSKFLTRFELFIT